MKKEDNIISKSDLRNLIIPFVKNEVKDIVEREIKDYMSNNVIEGSLIRVNDWNYIDEG
jgi:hypothetical protein